MTDPRPMSRTHAIRAARVLGSVIRIETLDIDNPVLFRYESGRWQWHTPGSEMWPGWNRTTLKHLDECLRASTPGDFRTQAPNFDAEEAVREARKGGEMLPHPFTHRFPDRNRSTTDRCTTCGSRSVHPIHDADPNHPLTLTDTDLAEIRAKAVVHPFTPSSVDASRCCVPGCSHRAAHEVHDWLAVSPGGDIEPFASQPGGISCLYQNGRTNLAQPAIDHVEQWREGWRKQGRKDIGNRRDQTPELRGKDAILPYTEGRAQGPTVEQRLVAAEEQGTERFADPVLQERTDEVQDFVEHEANRMQETVSALVRLAARFPVEFAALIAEEEAETATL